jgi:uncharacterized protein (TIGR02452 family)
MGNELSIREKITKDTLDILKRGKYQYAEGCSFMSFEDCFSKMVKGTIVYDKDIELNTNIVNEKNTHQVMNKSPIEICINLFSNIFNAPCDPGGFIRCPRIAILNFADFNTPGSEAFLNFEINDTLEAQLCRSSTLYHLFQSEKYKDNQIVFTPNVILFKDTNGNLLDYIYNSTINIISCSINQDNVIENTFKAAILNKIDIFIIPIPDYEEYNIYPDAIIKKYNEIMNKYKNCINTVIFSTLNVKTFSDAEKILTK